MKTLAVIFILTVLGGCALSGFSDNDDALLSCPPHERLNRIHPQVMVAFLLCGGADMAPLLENYMSFWTMACQKKVSKEVYDDATKAEGLFFLQFNDLFGKDNFKEVEVGLVELHNAMHPNEIIKDLGCKEKRAFKLKKKWF